MNQSMLVPSGRLSPSRPCHEHCLTHVLLTDNSSSNLHRSSGPSPVSLLQSTTHCRRATALVSHSSLLPRNEFTTSPYRPCAAPRTAPPLACRDWQPLPPATPWGSPFPYFNLGWQPSSKLGRPRSAHRNSRPFLLLWNCLNQFNLVHNSKICRIFK
jgi:hypothetical protein